MEMLCKQLSVMANASFTFGNVPKNFLNILILGWSNPQMWTHGWEADCIIFMNPLVFKSLFSPLI